MGFIMMNKKIDYYKNTLILFIGKFSSQLISFILLPLYTFNLSTSSYGYVDLIQTYISLLAPVLLLQMDSAVFRFLIDNREEEKEKGKIITSSFLAIVFVCLISSIIFLFICNFIKINYSNYIIINVIVLIISNYFMSISRGNGNNLNYSISSIIISVITLLTNIILILIFKYDARSILIASVIANLFSIIYLLKKEKIFNYISIKFYDKNLLKEMLKYSVPMIPNALSWWIVGLSDRTIIVSFIDIAANGVYSISCKFSNLLNSVFSIFSMSWQEMVSININEKKSEDFISKMMDDIFQLFVFMSCAIIGVMPLLYDFIIGKNYLNSYNYIPILLLANLVSVLAGLLGGIYVAKKNTKKVALTTIISAIINIIINVCFISKIGLYAACLSTLASYILMFLYRYYDVKKIFKIKLNLRNIVASILSYIFFSILYYLKFKFISLICLILFTALIIKKNKRSILNIITQFKLKRKL